MYLRNGELAWEWDGNAVANAAPSAGGSPATGASPLGVSSAARRRSRSDGSNGKPARPALPTVRLQGVLLHAITEQQCIDHILNELEAGQGGFVVTPNVDHLRRCTRDMHFGALVAEANLVLADGMPLVWASRLQKTPLPQRVAGSDLITTLSGAAATRGRSIFLLGGTPGTAEAASRILKEKCPGLVVAGINCPDVGFENDERAVGQIINQLQQTKPDIVFVGLGSPKQEKLIARLRGFLPEAWWLGVGVSFSFLCGDVRRAPVWMQKSGLEWIHRLAMEPRRLFKRYLLVGVPFACVLLAGSFVRGIPNRFRGAAEQASDASGNNGNGMAETGTEYDRPVSGSAEVVGLTTAPRLAEGSPSISPLDGTPHGSSITVGSPNESRMPSSHAGPNGWRSLNRLRGLVLLGGTVRATPLHTSIGRSILDLPLVGGMSILNHWLSHATELARVANIEKLPVRILVDRNSHEPVSADTKYYGTFRVERDLSEYRGTGGVLGDLANDYTDDDLILVANAAQVLLDPLAGIAGSLDRAGGEVALVAHEDGTPSGMMLLSCKTLRIIPRTGFVDMKEQALPTIASRFDVRVVERKRPSGLPIRTLADYIAALRLAHRRLDGKPARLDPLAEDWQPSFSIVEEGATVDPTARVHDSVVLKGGNVEAGTIMVRSIVCPGSIVKRDHKVVDEFVCAPEQPGSSRKRL